MSALAARRAAREAAAAAAASSPAITAPTARNGESSKVIDIGSQRPSKQPTPTPSSPSIPSSGDSESESDPDVIVESSSKRRRIDKSPSRPQRYFVQPNSGKRKKESREERAFSPSGPAELDDAGDSESDDASQASGSSDVGDVDDDVEAAMEVDEGTMRWTALSAPATPAPGSSGPARMYARPEGGIMSTGTSKFEPKEGFNVVRQTEEELAAAGIAGTGPGAVISLGPSETLMIAGTYSLTPLQQVIRLLNTTLAPDGLAYPVFAPTSHPIPVIQPASATSRIVSPLLRSLELPKGFRLVDGKEPRTVVLIREHACGLEGLKAGAVPGFTNAFLDGAGIWGLRGVQPVIGSFSTPVYPYEEPASWTPALGSLAPVTEAEDSLVPVVLVKGPKRTGKSSMARAALNTLLGEYQQVAWLECDLGQGEFGCGGMVGLWIVDRPVLGPPFTHPKVPLRAHYLGTYTPLTCPDEYIAAIRHLLDHYKYELQYATSTADSSSLSTRRNDVVPLVINTQGWVKGLGEDLLRSIESQAAPTHVFAFEHPALPEEEAYGPTQSYSPPYNPGLLPPEQGGSAEPARLFVLEPAPVSPLQARYTGADMRILSMISYLHGRRASDQSEWDLSVPLGAIPPVEVSVGKAGPIKQVFFVGEGADGVHPEDLELALNGSIVTLGRNNVVAGNAENGEDDVYVTSRPLPSHDDMNVFGLGLVRAIRREDALVGPRYTLQVITPLGGDVLEKVNSIVKNGAIELPTCGLLDWRGVGEKGEKVFGAVLEGGEVPFLERGGMGGGVGWERKRVRRNLQRRNM